MKRGVFLISICLFVLILSGLTKAGLGVTPAINEINFKPNLEYSVGYQALESDPDKILNIYAEGDFAKYVTFDKTQLTGGGGFTATLKLPEKAEKPGENKVYIAVAEKIDEELATVGTRVIMRAVIKVEVPYPYRYLELTSFTSNNANAGEPINFNLKLMNRGESELDIQPRIDIYSGENKLNTLNFEARHMASGDKLELKKSLDTTNYLSGDYRAVLNVDYGEKLTKEIPFKLGELNVRIVNNTQQIKLGGLRGFEVKVESLWNNPIDEAYAQVDLIRNSSVATSFKTSPETIEPWGKASLGGFFDTTNLQEGMYEANMTVFYSGKTTNAMGDVNFFVEKTTNWGLTIVFGILCLIVLVLLILVLFKFKHGRRKSKRFSRTAKFK